MFLEIQSLCQMFRIQQLTMGTKPLSFWSPYPISGRHLVYVWADKEVQGVKKTEQHDEVGGCSAPLTRMIKEGHFRRWYFSGDLINVKARGIESPRGWKGKKMNGKKGETNKYYSDSSRQTLLMDRGQSQAGEGWHAEARGRRVLQAMLTARDSDSFHGAPTAKANPPLHLCITLLTEHFPVLFHVAA